MKTAHQLFNDLTKVIDLPAGQTISVCEDEPRGKDGQNWIVAVGNLPPDAQARYRKVLKEQSEKHPIVDWSAVQAVKGERRCIDAEKLV
jgi:hypothetical protein